MSETKHTACSGSERFGKHGGRQFRSPRYFFCGCDAAYCEEHSTVNPSLPMELGQPRSCRKRTCPIRAKAEGTPEARDKEEVR